MGDKPNDRPDAADAIRIDAGTLPSEGNLPPDDDPRVFVVVGAERFPKPALQTFLAGAGATGKSSSTCTCNPVAGIICACNKVCTCVPAAAKSADQTSEPRPSGGCTPNCSCVGHTSGSGYSVCSCAPVH